ncbi:SixA phosphatase family protein [Kaarinaea lacus]
MDTYDLFIVRHAKSDWTNDVTNDFDRPLARRGEKSLPLIATWLRSHNIKPELLFSSPAKRAKQTADAIIRKLNIPQHSITFDKRLYLATTDTLVEVLAETAELSPPPASVMLVGHNPGLENLLLRLCADPLPYTEDGKLLTTGNVVQLRFNQSWDTLGTKQGQLVNFIRPKELP